MTTKQKEKKKRLRGTLQGFHVTKIAPVLSYTGNVETNFLISLLAALNFFVTFTETGAAFHAFAVG